MEGCPRAVQLHHINFEFLSQSDLATMGVWAMACPALPLYALRRPLLRQPYSRFRGGRPRGGHPAAVFYPFGYPQRTPLLATQMQPKHERMKRGGHGRP
jgi:hypothetical protein